MDVTMGMSEKTTTSTSWLYPLVKRLVWLTSAPPKLLVWNVIDWLASVSKHRRDRW